MNEALLLHAPRIAQENTARLAYRRDLAMMIEAGKRVGHAEACRTVVEKLQRLGMFDAADVVLAAAALGPRVA